MTYFTVVVRRIMSPVAARVYREPDAAVPAGRMYGLRLEALRDGAGNRLQIAEGDRLRVGVEEHRPDRITHVETMHGGTMTTHFAHA